MQRIVQKRDERSALARTRRVSLNVDDEEDSSAIQNDRLLQTIIEQSNWLNQIGKMNIGKD